MIPCPSCTSARPDCWLQQSVDRRGQLQCQHCARYFVFVASELIELDEVASQGFDLLHPALSEFKRRNLLIAGDLLDPHCGTPEGDPQARPRLELVKSELDDEPPISPYMEAWHWIENNIASDSAVSLAKLLLSFSDRYRAPFSFRECVRDLDEPRTELALRAVIHFANFDNDKELAQICEKVERAFPRLLELGAVAAAAQRTLRERWRHDDASPGARGRDDPRE